MTTMLALDRTSVIDWYRRNRERSEAIFDLLDPSVYYSRPIALRNPIVFYEGHLPAFSVIAFLRRGLGRPAIDAHLEKLFERGIDPDSVDLAVPRSGASTVWPSRDEVRAFARACDDAILEALVGDPLPAEGLFTALEHEAMHQETLLYMWHRVPYAQKRGPRFEVRGPSRGNATVRAEKPASVLVPAGVAHLGASRNEVVFGWDNEFDAHDVDVPTFEIDRLPVTNGEYLEFVKAGGPIPEFWISGRQQQEIKSSGAAPDLLDSCSTATTWFWRGMFEAIPLPLDWPVYVSQEAASAYARWKGRRLMTEAEFHRAAEGAAAGHADFAGYDPIPVGSHHAAATRWGVEDLIGNGWEWTSTLFAPFAGFVPMASYPEYSADFFDGQHFVLKGASPVTARELIRPSFRNWFRGNYPYVYAKFRTVSSEGRGAENEGR